MTLLQFSQPEADEPKLKKAVQNLLNHIPGEAATIYLAGLDMFGARASAIGLLVVALAGLGVLLLVRILAKASTATIVASSIAFVIWVYAIGGGPFEAFGVDFGQGVGAFLVVVYSTVVTILATYGLIKN
jgi:hypothetical protein